MVIACPQEKLAYTHIIMTQKPMISVVLGSYNRLRFLKLTTKTVWEELHDFPHEIIIIDGGSTDGTIDWLSEQKDIITIIQYNRGVFNGKPVERKSWGYFMNLGFRSAQGKYICMISDDCLVIPGAIRNGYKFFEEKLANKQKIGAVAFYYRNWPDEKRYKVSLALDRNIYVNHGLFLKSALEEINYIDEENFMFYYADSDLCLRLIRKGYDCIDCPTSFIEHFKHTDSAVRRSNKASANSDLDNYLKRWGGTYDTSKRLNDGIREKDFDDPYQTAKMFEKIGSVRFSNFKRRIKNIIGKF